MMSYFYKLLRKKGFTLVELIVVIAIIGVLTGILIPVMIGYTAKAQKANDLTVARAIYDKVRIVMTRDYDSWRGFYKHHTGSFVCTADGYCKTTRETGWNGASMTEGDYKIVVVCKTNGVSMKKGTKNAHYVWVPCNNELKYFTHTLNMELGLGVDRQKNNNSFNQTLTEEGKRITNKCECMYQMKYTSHENGKETNRWLICYKEKEPNQVEIWAGDIDGLGDSGALYRVYPNPCDEYK